MFKWLIPLLLIPSLALAQFNGTSGIYALNHMLFGVMASPFTVATPGSGYIASDTVTLDCPNTSVFQGNNSSYPVATYNGTVWTLTNPGVGTTIPTTGLAGGNNGTCVLAQIATSGSGTGVTFNATFGFNAASLNGFNTSGGGGGGGGTTYYLNHAALVAAVTSAPAIANTIIQQGFSASGDGGAATYNWVTSPTDGAYCPRGTSGSPTTADGIVCILPSGQSASTAGRYLLQVGPSIDVRSIGMQPGGQDNSPYIPTLMAALGPPQVAASGPDTLFPAIPGQNITSYYFGSGAFSLSRGGRYRCSSSPTTGYPVVMLVFAAGLDGVIQESNLYSVDGGSGQSNFTDCGIMSQESGLVTATPGSNTFTSPSFTNADPSGAAPISTWTVGDAIIPMPTGTLSPSGAVPAVSPGAYISSTSPLTLGGSYTVSTQLGAGNGVFTETSTNNIVVGDVFNIGNDTWTFVSSIGSTPGNVLIDSTFIKSMTNLANCINLNTTTATCVAQSTTPNVTADVPFNNTFKAWSLVAGTGGNSLVSTYIAAGTSAGSFGHATLTGGTATTLTRFYQLPVSLAYTVQTVTGSDSVLVTAGPRLLIPGDVVWSDAFPFGTTVADVSGTLGNQTAIMTIPFITTGQNATVTHTSGSPGTMWVMPAGLKRDVQAQASNNTIQYWPIGLEMACNSGASMNCTVSSDIRNIYEFDIVGRWVAGDNAGGSGSVNEESVKNYLTDLFEGGTVGSSYFGFNAESNEGGSAYASPLFNCANQNYSVMIGGYVGGASQGNCAASVGLIPPTVGGPLIIGPVATHGAGAPAIVNSPSFKGAAVYGPWEFLSGVKNLDCLLIGGANNLFAFSNNLCGTPTSWALTWNTAVNDWDVDFTGSGAPALRFIYGSTFLGNAGSGTALSAPLGLLLWNAEGYINSPNNSRTLSAGTTAPTGTWHFQGDCQLNTAVVTGGNMAWCDTPSFTTTLSTTVTGTPGTATVAACPVVALPAGTPIDDTTLTPPNLIGTLATCTGTTLTLQTTALIPGTIGDNIKFMIWEPVGVVQDAIPVISSCGTGSPAMGAGSNNIGGSFTMGTGTPTACTITFAHAYPTAAFCTVTPASSGGAAITGGDYISAQSAAGFTWTLGTGTSSLVFNYTCAGH